MPEVRNSKDCIGSYHREQVSPENIMEHILESKGIWIEVEEVTAAIYKKLKSEELSQKKERATNMNVNMST